MSATMAVTGSAVIDPTGQYRYRLTRRWGDESVAMGSTLMPFLMLNPSTADASQDDPTIRRCMGFARREGAHGITVVNVGAYRATDPKDWAKARDPFGPDNFSHIYDVAELAGYIVAAWGSNSAAREPARLILGRLKYMGIGVVLCLGTTKDGSPRHPLYVRADQPLVRFGTPA
jgi:hypothetical protein